MSFGRKYLRYPDLFPARSGGEAWGTGRVVLDLIGGPYRVQGLSDHQLEAVGRSYRPLVVDDDVEPSVDLRLFRCSTDDFLPLLERQELYHVDLDPAEQALRLACHEFMARFDWGPRLLGSLWTHDQQGEDFDRVFANFFRTAVAYAVLESGGALVHSAGLLQDGRALLFVGHSGAGKSTITRLGHQAGLQVLSDDLNALCLVDGALQLEKLPFAGEFRTEGPNGRFPLQAVYRLRKGRRFELAAVGEAEALAFLASCCPFVNSDPYRGDRLLANLDRLLQQMALRELTFPLSGGFWQKLSPGRAA